MNISVLIFLMFELIGVGLLSGCGSDDPQITGPTGNSEVKEVSIPLAGNAYQTSESSGERVQGNGIEHWSDKESTFSVFFKTMSTGDFEVYARARTGSGESRIKALSGDQVYEVDMDNENYEVVPIGTFSFNKEEYSSIDLKGVDREGSNFAQLTDLVVEVPKGDTLVFVKENSNNRFYWGRRGPSVHLGYSMPAGVDIEWFYNEVTVPEGEDPLGSYFMANGFSQGYFGIQVNSETERRVLFSVWSPYQTDNPDDIPESERIQLIEKGQDVVVGEFGNEGSGGQSYLIFPWKAGITYKFLNQVKPDGEGNTINTAYFYDPEQGEWRLIASFLRPITDTWMTGVYSFLENFHDTRGYKWRRAFYGNQWALDKNGSWHQITKATFTGDDIANTGYRLDFSGGAEEGRFFLRNGGYKTGSKLLNSVVIRQAVGEQPELDISNFKK